MSFKKPSSRKAWDAMMAQTTEAAQKARALAKSGWESISERFSDSQSAEAQSAPDDPGIEQEVTHYLLVPLPERDHGHAVYTKRILPPACGAVNSLPKLRVFHVPDPAGKELLEDLLITAGVESGVNAQGKTSDLGALLERMADRIERDANRISSGFLLSGVVVALINPVAGLVIGAQALLPPLVSNLSRTGAEYVGDKVNAWKQSSLRAKLRKGAEHEVRHLRPVIFPNPILRALEAITTNADPEFDPALDRRVWVDQFPNHQCYQVTVEAIRSIYQPMLGRGELEHLPKAHRQWIESLS